MLMERLTLHELATATRGALTCAAGRRIAFNKVSVDSRTTAAGDVFFALPGARHDGRRYIADAIDRGAVAAVAEQPSSTSTGPLVVVDDAVEALGRFAGWYRSLLDALVIGVTGSVGKTTTRELIHAALGGEPASIRSRLNYNNRIGVPLTLLDVEREHRYAVVEMGADRPGDIGKLARIARPEVGVITHLGVAHVETFGSEQAIAQAKGELIEELPIGGFAVLPGDQDLARRLVRRCRANVLFVGESKDNTHRVAVRDCQPGRLRFSVDDVPFEVNAGGKHFAVAAGMAVTVARTLGRSDRQIAAGLRTFEPVAGRCRVAITAPWTVVDDTYNANPDSMRAAIEALAAWPTGGRRVLVCGDMYGLGERANAEHIELGRRAAASAIDLVAAIGDFAGQVAHGACRSGMDARCLALFPERDRAADWLRDTLRPGDVVWVKASRPLQLEQLVAALASKDGPHVRRAA